MKNKLVALLLLALIPPAAIAAADRVLDAQKIRNRTYLLTLPASTDTLLGRNTVDTLINKTIDASANTLLNLPSQKAITEALSNKTIDCSLNTCLNLPSQKAVAETLTNKTIDCNANTCTNFPSSGGSSGGGFSNRVFLVGPESTTGSAPITNGTWTAPAGVTKIFLRIRGAGGGGGGGGYNTSSYGGGGSGGGSGAYVEAIVTVVPGTSYAYRIGAGGAPGASQTAANTGNNGSAGNGDTYLTVGAVSYIAAPGGGGYGGGAQGQQGGPGGSPGTAGLRNVAGTWGDPGFPYAAPTGSPAYVPGGNGASTEFCGGGPGGRGAGDVGRPGAYKLSNANLGPQGSGGCGGGGGSVTAAGGWGANGIIEISY